MSKKEHKENSIFWKKKNINPGSLLKAFYYLWSGRRRDTYRDAGAAFSKASARERSPIENDVRDIV